MNEWPPPEPWLRTKSQTTDEMLTEVYALRKRDERHRAASQEDVPECS